MLLLILDSLGGTELLVILVVALIIFGPRKLPQLSRSLGRSLSDFKRASYEFKQTWEREASLADLEEEERKIGGRAALSVESPSSGETIGRSRFGARSGQLAATEAETASASSVDNSFAEASAPEEASALVPLPSVTSIEPDAALREAAASDAASSQQPASKRDWL